MIPHLNRASIFIMALSVFDESAHSKTQRHCGLASQTGEESFHCYKWLLSGCYISQLRFELRNTCASNPALRVTCDCATITKDFIHNIAYNRFLNFCHILCSLIFLLSCVLPQTSLCVLFLSLVLILFMLLPI